MTQEEFSDRYNIKYLTETKGLELMKNNKRRLGKSDLTLSRIGFGAWAIGGEWEWGWGSQDDQKSIKTIHKAL